MTLPESRIAQGSFEALAESAPDAILTIGEDSTILTANAAVERVFGYCPAELVGKKLTVLIPERLRGSHEHGIARYLRTHKRNIPWTGVELPAARKDGSELPVEISFGEFVDENGRHIFSGFVRDVSERVRQHREIQEARADAERALADLARLGRIIDAPLGRMTFDTMLADLLARMRDELYVDSAALMLLDESTRELTVRGTLGLPEEVSALRIPIGSGISGRVAASGEPLLVEDSREAGVTSAALGPGAVSLAAVPVRSEERIIGVLVIGAAQPGRFDNADVRILQLVAERTAGVFARARLFDELQQRRAEADAAVKARDDVLSIVSHDLRNPVSTIVMSVSLLTDPEIKLDEAQRQRQLSVIASSAQRMNRLIQDLIDVARIEGRRLTVDCKCEQPGALATEAFESFRVIAEEKQISLACDVEQKLPLVKVDRDRVLQVLTNYLNNAIKFTPKGGRVRVRAKPTDGGGACYAVEDTGPGIREEDIANIFNRFWQAKRTAHLGSGLGLTIARGIAEAHRGRVWVESTLGQGATFYFELPPSSECAGSRE